MLSNPVLPREKDTKKRELNINSQFSWSGDIGFCIAWTDPYKYICREKSRINCGFFSANVSDNSKKLKK